MVPRKVVRGLGECLEDVIGSYILQQSDRDRKHNTFSIAVELGIDWMAISSRINAIGIRE